MKLKSIGREFVVAAFGKEHIEVPGISADCKGGKKKGVWLHSFCLTFFNFIFHIFLIKGSNI